MMSCSNSPTRLSPPSVSPTVRACCCAHDIARFTITQMQQDIAALSDELLAQTLPADRREPGGKPAPPPVEADKGDEEKKGDEKAEDGDKEKKKADEKKD